MTRSFKFPRDCTAYCIYAKENIVTTYEDGGMSSRADWGFFQGIVVSPPDGKGNVDFVYRGYTEVVKRNLFCDLLLPD
jgi:hypothetical protein